MRVVVTGGAGLVGRVVAGYGSVALASLIVACSGAAMPAQTAEPTTVVNVRRTATEVLFDVPGWRRSGAQVYLCPRVLTLDPDPERLRSTAEGSHCLDLGAGAAGSGIEGIGMPFDSLSMADRATFDAARRWFVVIVESPTPVGRPPAMIQREVAGGPIAP